MFSSDTQLVTVKCLLQYNFPDLPLSALLKTNDDSGQIMTLKIENKTHILGNISYKMLRNEIHFLDA